MEQIIERLADAFIIFGMIKINNRMILKMMNLHNKDDRK